MKETYYFPHDFNPTNDPKIICLLGNFGGLGYGTYWRIVELLHQEEEHKLPLKMFIFEAIAKQMLANAKQIEAMVNECIKTYELFETDGLLFWSNRVLTNIKKRQEISEIRSIAGKAGALAKQNVANKSKVKESKVNKNKEKKTKENIPTNVGLQTAEAVRAPSEEELQKQKDTNKEIQKILEPFYKLNPLFDFANKTERKAIKEIVDKLGFEKALKMTEYAISIQGDRFAPVVTKPTQLKRKMGEIGGYWKKQQSSNNKITIAGI